MGHPFVPMLLVVWALSVALRGCGTPAATLPPEQRTVRPADPVTEKEPPLAPGARQG